MMPSTRQRADPLSRSWMPIRRPRVSPSTPAAPQSIIHGDADLAWVALLKKGLVGKVWWDQPKIKPLLRIARIEEIADPQACRPGTVRIPDPNVLQVIGARGLRIAGVVIKIIDRGRVKTCEPTLWILVFRSGGELIAGRERLRAPIDTKAGEYT